jgi:dihydroflavonol-4-reductase
MAARKKVIVVTGATGFVGRHCVERLLAEKTLLVRCLVRPGSDLAPLRAMGSRVSFCCGDITRPESLKAAFKGAWGVVNLAGYREFWSRSPDHFYTLNEQGAKNVFQACLDANVRKVVQVSTPLAYGVPGQIPFNEDTPPGRHSSAYARSKYLGDKAGLELCQQEGLPLTVVYLAAVIGAGDDKSTMEVRRAVERKLPALVGADTTYTYLYVRDAAEAIVRALLAADAVGRRYLIGNQRATTREYFGMIGKLADVPIPDWNIPEAWLFPLAWGMQWWSSRTGVRPLLPLDVIKTTAAGSLLFDASRAEKELGMRYTPLESALAEAISEIQAA